MIAALANALASATSTSITFATREEWLMEFVGAMRPAFAETGSPLPEKVRVSCGFPKGCRKAIGQCWSDKVSEDGAREIFVSPVLSEAPRVCDVVIHELVHAALPDGTKHGAEFKQLATDMGLAGPMTATEASAELTAALAEFIPVRLGPYPHSKLSPMSIAKQTTRMIKLTCDGCGMVVRSTRKWLDDVGPPNCACGSAFEENE